MWQYGPGVLFAVLLQLLEAVTTSLSFQYHSIPELFLPVLSRAARLNSPFNSTPALQLLECVTIRVKSSNTSYDAAYLLPLFLLQAMRRIPAHAMFQTHKKYPTWLMAEPGKSGVKELRLSGTLTRCHGQDEMTDLITACASLEIFEYQHRNRNPWNEICLFFHPGAFHMALLALKSSFRELRLNDNGQNTNEDCDELFGEPEAFNRFGSPRGLLSVL